MADEQQINKWPDDQTDPRNQCKEDGCKFPRIPHTPWCYQHGQSRWAARVVELQDELIERNTPGGFDPAAVAAFDAQNEGAS